MNQIAKVKINQILFGNYHYQEQGYIFFLKSQIVSIIYRIALHLNLT